MITILYMTTRNYRLRLLKLNKRFFSAAASQDEYRECYSILRSATGHELNTKTQTIMPCLILPYPTRKLPYDVSFYLTLHANCHTVPYSTLRYNTSRPEKFNTILLLESSRYLVPKQRTRISLFKNNPALLS